MSSQEDILLPIQHNYWNNQRHTLSSHLFMSAQSPAERSFILPPELLIEVFRFIGNDQKTLYSASLVCKEFFYCAAPVLYCHPQINDTYRWATFILTLTRERMSFSYGEVIRSIDLSSGKSIEAMKDHEFYRRLSDTNDNHQQGQAETGEVSHFRILLDTAYNNTGNNNTNNANTPTNQNNTNNESPPGIQARGFRRNRRSVDQDYILRGLPFIIVSTSSLIQMSNTCKYLTSLNLSYTSLLHDSVVAETGEYLCTLQRYAVQPGLTHIQIPIEEAIEAIGKSCSQLQVVRIQRCEWVTAHVIWMFAYYCANLKKLDARRSTKCTVKRLISHVLELPINRSRSDRPDVGTTPLRASLRNYPATRPIGELFGASATTSMGEVFAAPTLTPFHEFQNEDVMRFETHSQHEAQGLQELEEELQQLLEEQEEEDSDNDEDDEDEEGDVGGSTYNDRIEEGALPMLRLRFNDEAGTWERDTNEPQPRQGIQTFTPITVPAPPWGFPAPMTEREGPVRILTRRSRSPRTRVNVNTTECQSLKELVHRYIMDCKNLGAIDLNWIQDYR